MEVHYFYKRDWNGNWFAIQLEAIMEEDCYSHIREVNEKSFTYIEQIRCHISKDMDRFHSSAFKIDFGINACYGDSSRTVSGLYKSKTEKNNSLESFIPVTRAQYERLRKFAFAVYEKHKCMDFDMVKEKQTYSITTIIE